MLKHARGLFVAALVGAVSLLPAAEGLAQQPGGQTPGAGLVVPITGTTSIGGEDVPLQGNFRIQRFQVNPQGQIEAVGTAVFQFADPSQGGQIRTIVRQLIRLISLDQILDPGAGPCPILLLEIPGGVHLDVLGLVINLDPIRLEIVAEPGPGNLLGNLLCALVGLLDQGGPVQQIVASLNNLLRLLG
jgi:hypothetical protein